MPMELKKKPTVAVVKKNLGDSPVRDTRERHS